MQVQSVLPAIFFYTNVHRLPTQSILPNICVSHLERTPWGIVNMSLYKWLSEVSVFTASLTIMSVRTECIFEFASI